ncbi:MAG: hypothetical protein GY788_24165, partial [bacterium]|nr:hypothetical protein [bacterium]
SQGAGPDRQVSADEFFDHALRWFGHGPEPLRSPWEQGVRLAELVRARRTLLVLDGLEPLQHPPGELLGRLRDQGLIALLKDLARDNPGLCLICTRLAVTDLADTRGAENHNLENLDAEAGADLLSLLGVQGTRPELATTAHEFGGHALALSLLGRYLAVVHQGEIRKRDLVPALTDERDRGGHAKRVMARYETWLADSAELKILYLMGLFDRPAPAGALTALRAEPAIAGLTDTLTDLPEADWRYAVQHLRELHLLAKKDESREQSLDCHPLVREYFGARLRGTRAPAWRAAHARLYAWYKDQAKDLPDSLAEMEPLFAAVAHGCRAGKHQEALVEVYYSRIQRDGRTNYCCNKLGAFGADLAALAHFFRRPWKQPAAGLTDFWKAGVLSWAGFGLRALGRLREAAEPMKAGMDLSAQKKDWKGAAQDAGNLSELYLTLGVPGEAVACARQAVGCADGGGDAFLRETMRSTLADALHQAGEPAQAEDLFREAEAL